MTDKALSLCAEPGCRRLTRSSRCADHRRTANDVARGKKNRKLYNRRWEKSRTRYLAKHPLCVTCLANGKTAAATEIGHIVPHGGDLELFWRSDNWQVLCKSGHSRKTVRGK